jgi:hypothetical protein
VAGNNLFLVFTNPVKGREAIFNEWYDATHVPDVLAVPGVVAAQRYEVAPVETPELEGTPPPAPPVHGYLTVYELSRDANEVMADFLKRLTTGVMKLSDAMDMTTVALSVWRPRGDRKLALKASKKS